MKIRVKHHLEGKKPTRFFSSIMKKRMKTEQFNTLVKTVTDEYGETTDEFLDKQENIDDEVCSFYEGL